LASAARLSLCLGTQSFVTYAQNAKKPRQRQAVEQLIFFTLLKPGIDAWRASTYTRLNREERVTTDPQFELAAMRGAELVFESIPGTVTQITALLTSKELDETIYMALLSSILTSASTSCYMSLDYDRNKENREMKPNFYGYVDHGWRGIVSVTANFVCSMCNLTIRALACALLSLKSMGELMAVLGCEMLLYYGSKTFRGDIHSWIPSHGIKGRVITLLHAFIVKLLADWTFFVQLRNPVDIGGVYFCFNLIPTLAIGLFSTYTLVEVGRV